MRFAAFLLLPFLAGLAASCATLPTEPIPAPAYGEERNVLASYGVDAAKTSDLVLAKLILPRKVGITAADTPDYRQLAPSEGGVIRFVPGTYELIAVYTSTGGGRVQTTIPFTFEAGKIYVLSHSGSTLKDLKLFITERQLYRDINR